MVIKPQEELILPNLIKFYNRKKNYLLFNKIVIIGEGAPLRNYEHFAVRYSADKNLYLKVNERRVHIHTDYQSQLKAFGKKMFDPFRRGNKIKFMMGDKNIETTLRQLNFMKWIIENEYYKYVEKCAKDIEKHYKQYKLKKKKKPVKIHKNIMQSAVSLKIDFS